MACPVCGSDAFVGARLVDLQVIGPGPHMHMTCPRGHRFDATAGRPGTYSTVDGRFASVARTLADADQEARAELLRTLQKAREEGAGPERTGELVMSQVPAMQQVGSWLKEHSYLATWGSFLVALIAVVGHWQARTAAPDMVRQIVRELEAAADGRPLDPTPPQTDREQSDPDQPPRGAARDGDAQRREQHPEQGDRP